MDREQLLSLIKSRLRKAHGTRLERVVLYGSEARGTAGAGSDIDLLVVLAGPISLWRDLRTSIDALYDLQLELDRSIHVVPVGEEVYRTGRYALCRVAMEEGVAA